MTADPPRPTDPDLVWGDDGLPRSGVYGDVYFSSDDGLEETRAVFLSGGGLPEAWTGRSRFTVAELGFGTGLNIAALLDLWRREGPPDARLSIFSIEAHPLSREDAARALGRWPELAGVAGPLLARWPRRSTGFHRVEFPEFRATLDLAVMDVAVALDQWSGRADLWFLDGFSPATNPAMWRPEVLQRLAARSAPGAAVATFTVAGDVRRGLAAAGFEVAKRPGFGRKRERLEARLPGPAAEPARPRSAAVVGAGIAGASLARALEAQGLTVTLIDAEGSGAGASGNPAALVTPRLDAGLGPVARLFAQCLARAGDLYRTVPGAVVAQGVLQLAKADRDEARFAAIAAADLFDAGAMVPATAAQSSDRLSEPAPAGLDMREALVIAPAPVLTAFAGAPTRATVAAIAPGDGGWRLLDASGAEVARADVVCLAAGHAAARLAPGLPELQPIRGQATWTADVPAPAAAAFGGYVAPLAGGGVLFGATHDRDREDREVDPDDDRRNLEQLAGVLPRLAAATGEARLSARASVRAATRDRLHLAGAVPGADGLFVLAGLGSRGFCAAPLLAEHVAALAAAAPSPLPADLAALVDPSRFEARARRRGSRD